MKKLLGFFRKRWMVTLLGLGGLSTVVWILGPELSFGGHFFLEGRLSRLLAIGLIFALWGLNKARRYWLEHYRGRRLQSGGRPPAPDPAGDASRAQVAALRAKFDDALLELKANLGRGFGDRYLYALPWYIIIGRPRIGKTTALATADLNFFRETPGFDQTVDCDWFLTDKAVLVDTAGRYVARDHDREIDRRAWQGFLGLLKKYRPRRPVNGVLVAASADDLMRMSESERVSMGRTIRERLQELHQGLGIRFPVYLLVTKCDLLAGFTEFFSALDKRQRAQVWGMTLPLYEDLHTPPERLRQDFNDEFTLLEQRLGEQLLERVDAERHEPSRDLIFAFPRQFSALRSTLDQFLADIVQPNLRRETPLLRGIYFTSGTQQGSPIDQVMHGLADTFGVQRQALPAQSGSGRSYFVTNLLQDVVFPEAGLANTNLGLERRRGWLQRGIALASCVVAVVVCGYWVISFLLNSDYITQFKEKVAAVQQAADDLPNRYDVLTPRALLDAARNLPGGYGRPEEGRSWLMNLGLGQRDFLGHDGAIPTYKRLLDQALKPRLRHLLETELGTGSGDDARELDTLRAYLVLSGERSDRRGETISAWWNNHPRGNDPSSRNTQIWRDMQIHVSALQNHLGEAEIPFINPDANLVRQAQRRLEQPDTARWVYDQLKRKCLAGGIADFELGRNVGPSALVFSSTREKMVLQERVPGCFTRSGYQEFFPEQAEVENLLKNNWALAAEAADSDDVENLTREVRRLYLEDYAKQWRGLLERLQIRQLSSYDVAQSVEITRTLADPRESPLLKLLQAVSEQTTLAAPPLVEIAADPDGGDGFIKKIFKVFKKVPRKVANLVNSEEGEEEKIPVDEDVALLIDQVLNRHFNDLHRAANEDVPTKLLPLLSQLAVQMEAFADYANEDGDRSGTLLSQARDDASRAMKELEAFGRSQSEPLSGWLLSLTGAGRSAVTTSETRKINKLLNEFWADEVYSFCGQAITGYYPLSQASQPGVMLQDFGEFFGFGGRVDTYFQNYLRKFVDTSRTPWSWYPRKGLETPAVSAEALRQLQRAESIKKAFFADGGKKPMVRFELRPKYASADIKRVVLTIGTQEIEYRHDPNQSRHIEWPDPSGSSVFSIRFDLFDTSRSIQRSFDGPWAWFRWLQQGDFRRSSSQWFSALFKVEGYEVEYEIRPSSVFNPFDLMISGELKRFRCPRRL